MTCVARPLPDSARWNGAVLPAAALDAQLAHAARLDPQPAIVVDASELAPYGHVATVLASAERAGITGIGFARD